MFYIATEIHGRGYQLVTAYDSANDFRRTALMWLARGSAGWEMTSRSPINDVCHALRDAGPGFGARSHRRVSYKKSRELQRNCAETYGY